MPQPPFRHQFSKDIYQALKPLHRLDNYHGLAAWALNAVLIGSGIVAGHVLGWPGYILAIVLIGSRQRALATLVHEASHRALARNRTLNDALGTLASGYLLLMLFHAYRRSHVHEHHGQFGDAEGDADYRLALAHGVYDCGGGWRYVWHVLVSPALLFKVPAYLGYLMRDRLFNLRDPGARTELLLLAAYWLVLLAVLAHLQLLPQLFWYWVVPFLTTYQIIGWYIELAEHAPMMENGADIAMSRNRHSHPVEHFLTGMHNENYHLAHHLFPKVPFWRMKQLNELLRQDPAYRRQDDACGGIFVSGNGAPSVASILWARAMQPTSPLSVCQGRTAD